MATGQVLIGDILAVAATLAPGGVQMVATSPPYWGLRLYPVPPTAWPAIEYAPMPGLPPVAVPAQTVCLGQEATIEAFIGHLVQVFRALRPALRDDGTLWLNLGDSYVAGGNGARDPVRWPKQSRNANGFRAMHAKDATGLAPKNLCGIPWRAAFALQADGWVLRSEIIWHKVSPMPESVTDRPTKAHEQVFLFSKRPTYFYDADAVREQTGREMCWEEYAERTAPGATWQSGGVTRYAGANKHDGGQSHPAGRNKRTVWSPSPSPFPGAHFSTWPADLVRPMVRAGSSDAGCCGACLAPYRRVVARETNWQERKAAGAWAGNVGVSATYQNGVHGAGMSHTLGGGGTTTTGWEPTCQCGASVVPCTVLDCFMGSGTTLQVAHEEGRHWLGIDADPRAVGWAEERLRALPVGRLPLAGGA